jgi:NADPH:quinone reductase
MKAMVITDFGGPEVFAERDLPKPDLGVREILVRVRATSVNPVDYKMRKGGSWAGITPPAILGLDAAGVVEAIGPGVRYFKPGDAVFYTPHLFGGRSGTYAEYHVVEEKIVAAKPPNISFEEAAAVPLAGCTAYDEIIGTTRVRPGETVLVHAAAGGVGVFAVQLAKACGARVIGTCGTQNVDFLRSIGADAAIDHKTRDFVAVLKEDPALPGGVDVAIDNVGGETLARSLEIVRPHGRMASIVSTTGNLSAAYGKNITIDFIMMERSRAKMETLRVLITRGQLRPIVESVMPLREVAEAHRRIEAGGTRGKIVLRVPE